MLKKILFFIIFLCFSCNEISEIEKKPNYSNHGKNSISVDWKHDTVWFNPKEEMLKIIGFLEMDICLGHFNFFEAGVLEKLRDLIENLRQIINGSENYILKRFNKGYSSNRFMTVLVSDFIESLIKLDNQLKNDDSKFNSFLFTLLLGEAHNLDVLMRTKGNFSLEEFQEEMNNPISLLNSASKLISTDFSNEDKLDAISTLYNCDDVQRKEKIRTLKDIIKVDEYLCRVKPLISAIEKKDEELKDILDLLKAKCEFLLDDSETGNYHEKAKKFIENYAKIYIDSNYILGDLDDSLVELMKNVEIIQGMAFSKTFKSQLIKDIGNLIAMLYQLIAERFVEDNVFMNSIAIRKSLKESIKNPNLLKRKRIETEEEIREILPPAKRRNIEN